MNPDRWVQVDRLLDEALERAPQERAAFLTRACQGDDELRREVESLLTAHAQAADGFLQTPALEVAAKKLAGESHRSLVGRTLGPYSVVSVLGAGGMGEVYLARDTRLGRKVALKLLPKQFTADAARVRRFATEARAASALNHPNILTIYEIGVIEAEHFIAAEYIDGVTIREQINGGKIAVKDALEMAVQIASALAAAHEAGIVHRDIKPENVMRRPDGYIKVLDFGLAKLTERHPSLAQTRGGEADIGQTNPGTVLGTISYMSPEQALGHEVDGRTDIFSLGVLLYEMLAGVVPFKGSTNAALLDAIVHHQPLALTAVRADAPVELARIVNRALEKDRELRYQTANDLRADLKRLQRELDSAPAHSVARSRAQTAPVVLNRRRSALLITAVIAVLALSSVFWWFNARAPRSEAALWLNAYATQLTDFAGEERDLSLDPDGKTVFYSRVVNGNRDIFRQRVDGSNTQNLTADTPEEDSQPACSPDGSRVVFYSERKGGGLFVMGATGESVRQLSDIGFNPAWSPDGKEIVCSTASIAAPAARSSIGALWIINVETGARRPLPTPADAVQPRWSPNGQRIAYSGRDPQARNDIWTIPAAGGEPTRITNDADLDWHPLWSADGQYLYFVSDRKGAIGLWRVPIDEATGQAQGAPEAVLNAAGAQLWRFDLSRDGRRLVYLRRFTRSNLQAVDFDPQKLALAGQPVWITQGNRPIGAPDVSPDGALLTHHSSGSAQEDLFVMGSDGSGAATNLTNDLPRDRTPRWSPDGKRIAFYSNFDGGAMQIWLINPDGSGRRKLTDVPRGTAYPFWSPDGRQLGYSIIASQTYLIEVDKPWAEQTPFAVPLINAAKEWFIGWDWSDDGGRIAGWSGGLQSGEVRDLPGVYLYSVAAQTYEKISNIGERPVWLKDNRHLLFIHAGDLYLVDAQTKKPRLLLAPSQDAIRHVTISQDNRRIYYDLAANEADIYLLTLEK